MPVFDDDFDGNDDGSDVWGRIHIAMNDGTSRTVTAEIVGAFGLHDGGHVVRVTHIASGRCVGEPDIYVTMLNELPIAWSEQVPDYVALLPTIFDRHAERAFNRWRGAHTDPDTAANAHRAEIRSFFCGRDLTMATTQSTDDQALDALGVSGAIRRHLAAVLKSECFDNPTITPIIARAPSIANHALAELWLSHALAMVLTDRTLLPGLLDRLDTMRTQLVTIGTAGVNAGAAADTAARH
jgi:hypothetical protein